ncbi:lipocalin-15-like isoform X1 [Heliangelus exortis]|uniref:lipocalin-15-like isoform X1 n=1 Tax=Heliangelus exortis TaxID=472823 RepID=UPI003A8FD618
MPALLPSLALTLLCLLQAVAEVPLQPNFNAEKFAGMWRVTAVASNCPVFLKMKDDMKSSTATISITSEGDLAMTLVWLLMGKCQKFEVLFQHSKEAGHYLAAQEQKELHVMETDYSHYAILHEVQRGGQEPSTGLQLLTRDQNVSPQLLQKFKELIPSMGLAEEMLAVLPASDQCMAEGSWVSLPA